MLHISTEGIKYSTTRASFRVTFSVPPEEIYALGVLHEKYSELNMKGFPVTTKDMIEDEPQAERSE